MAHVFRVESPKRTCTKKYTDYHKYKDDLAKDFNHKCGYTDTEDFYYGGQRCFQIDHFKPVSKHKELETEYSNLVYCCSYVNRLKWDDDNSNYLDPCDVDFNEHFERDDNGYIVAKTVQAKYMHKKMCLGLSRYAIIWNLMRIKRHLESLKKYIDKDSAIKELLSALYIEYDKYENYLRNNQ